MTPAVSNVLELVVVRVLPVVVIVPETYLRVAPRQAMAPLMVTLPARSMLLPTLPLPVLLHVPPANTSLVVPAVGPEPPPRLKPPALVIWLPLTVMVPAPGVIVNNPLTAQLSPNV